MSDETDLRQALNEVRKAYRWIWLYQNRVEDIIRIIRDQFDHEFYSWGALTGRPGNLGSDPLLRPVWSKLPFYYFSLLHLPPEVDSNHPKAGEWMLEITVMTDDGFPRNNQNAIPTDFSPTEECNSYLQMVAWYCTKNTDADWYYGIWERNEWPDQEGVLVEHSAPPVKVILKKFDLATFHDKESTISAVGE